MAIASPPLVVPILRHLRGSTCQNEGARVEGRRGAYHGRPAPPLATVPIRGVRRCTLERPRFGSNRRQDTAPIGARLGHSILEGPQ